MESTRGDTAGIDLAQGLAARQRGSAAGG